MASPARTLPDGTIEWTDGTVTDADGNPIGGGNVVVPGAGDPTTVAAPPPGSPPPETPPPGSPPPGSPPPADTSGLPQWVKDLIDKGVDPSLLTSALQSAGLLAAGKTARDALLNAGKTYTTTAEKYAAQLDPYGSYRKAAADKLAALQADPSSIQDTPGYKFALQQGLGAVGNRDNQRFGLGAGSTNPDLMTFAQGLASKTYNDTIKQYSDQAGVGIGPAAAAGVLNTGMQGNINADLGAANVTNNMISAFTTPGANTTRTTPPGGTPPPTGGPPGTSVASNLLTSGWNAVKNWSNSPTTVKNDVPNVDSTNDTIYNQGGAPGSATSGGPDIP